MEELFGAILGLIFECLAEFLAELILVLVADALSRLIRKFFASTRRASPLLVTLIFALAGVAAGYLSVLIFPHPLVHPSRFHGVSLIISPLAMGAFMAFLGKGIRRRGRNSVAIESFRYGFTFALAMALVRFALVTSIRIH